MKERLRLRYAANPEKAREAARALRRADIEHAKALERSRYAANPKKANARSRAWRQANPETMRNLIRNYRKANPAKVAEMYHRRRARLRDASSPGVTPEEWLAILEVFGHACAYCLRTDKKLTRDHVLALASGGLDSSSNVVPACQSCNSRKGPGTLLAFVAKAAA